MIRTGPRRYGYAGAMPSLFNRVAQRLGRGGDDEGRDPARSTADERTSVRDLVTLRGSLRTVTLRPRDGVPTLEAELENGSRPVVLVWLGRRRIPGIEPGRRLTVHGRLGERDGQTVLFNPRYELST